MKENFFVIDVDYTVIKDRAAVRLYCKDKSGKTVLVLDSIFNPYFYAMPKEGKLSELKKNIENLDEKELETKIVKVESVERDWEGRKTKMIKITIDDPGRIPDVRNAVKNLNGVEETYEYAIPFYRRYIIDKQIEPTGWIEVDGDEVKLDGYQVDRVIDGKNVRPVNLDMEIEPRVLAFDTELVEEDGKEKIVMLSVVGDDYKKVLTTGMWAKKPSYVEVLPDEKIMIERFLEIVNEKDPDFICSYNGDNFDFPKLKERAAELKLGLKLGRDTASVYIVRRGRVSSAKTKGRVHIDLFNFVSNVLSSSMKSEVLTLDAVAQELLGIGKKKMKFNEIQEVWDKKYQLEKLADYCLWDSELVLKLSRHLLPQIVALSRLTGLIPFDASRYTYSQLVEAYYMRRSFVDNRLIPNRPKTDELERRRMTPLYKGALVIEPKKGIHSDILVFDFRSLYPTIIVTHNISPETLNCGHKECEEKNKVPENEWYFCTKVNGFIPTHLSDLIERRKKIKERMKAVEKDSLEWKKLDSMQYALKIVANASYGYTGYFGARWYSRDCAQSTTAFGRFYITRLVEMAKKEGLEIVYGDTDSMFVRFHDDDEKVKMKKGQIIKKAEEFAQKVNKTLPGIIELEFRDLYEGGIFVARKGEKVGAKKRYALVDYEGNLEIRGFETVRRDWCDLSKRIQRDVLTIILRDKDPAKAVELVRDTIKKIKDGEVELDDLTILEQITRPLSQYEAISPHVKAAQKARDRGRPVGEGTIMGFIITKGTGSISDRAEPVEDVKPDQYDPDYYINHQVLPASMRVLKALEYTEEEVLSGKVQSKLGKWFKK